MRSLLPTYLAISFGRSSKFLPNHAYDFKLKSFDQLEPYKSNLFCSFYCNRHSSYSSVIMIRRLWHNFLFFLCLSTVITFNEAAFFCEWPKYKELHSHEKTAFVLVFLHSKETMQVPVAENHNQLCCCYCQTIKIFRAGRILVDQISIWSAGHKKL